MQLLSPDALHVAELNCCCLQAEHHLSAVPASHRLGGLQHPAASLQPAKPHGCDEGDFLVDLSAEESVALLVLSAWAQPWHAGS